MTNFKDLKSKLLKDKEVKKAYDKLEPEFLLAKNLIQKRIEKGLTQKQLATKVGTKQSAISRLESGNANPSFLFLQKIALALGGELRVSIM